MTLPIDRLPEDIMNRAHKVFSKHSSREVKEWSRQLMKSYQLLHAVEKPMNLDYVKAFANTSDLMEMTPEINFDLAEERAKERDFKMKQGSLSPEDASTTIDMEQGNNDLGGEGGDDVNENVKARQQSKSDQKEDK